MSSFADWVYGFLILGNFDVVFWNLPYEEEVGEGLFDLGDLVYLFQA